MTSPFKHCISVLAATVWASAACAAPAEITLPGERLFPESLTSTADGSVIIGSVGARTIFRAKPGAATAEPWIQPGAGGLQAVFGVLADDAANTLWACSGSPAFGPPQPGAPPPQPSALLAFDLKTGAPKGSYPLPTAGGMCNDIAVGADGSAYATDTTNMEVLRLPPGGKALEVWAGNGAFGPRGGVLDGIAMVNGRVVVNTLATSKLFSVAVEKEGKAGAVTELKLDQPIERPDGMRSFGKDGLLTTEAGGSGKLTRVQISGDRGKVSVLKEGFPDGPVSVTVVGEIAYVLEGQLMAMMRPPGAAPAPAPKPFKATAVSVGKP